MRYPAVLSLLLLVFSVSFKEKEQSGIDFNSRAWQKKWSLVKEGYWMQKTEVSNEEYALFLDALKAMGKEEEYEFYYPDSLAWQREDIVYKPYGNTYFTNPAFKDYPVVNISFEAAYDYCKWLTAAYNKSEKKPFGKVVFQIPSRDLWMYAASGGKTDNRSYPWGGMYLYNNRKERLCNFKADGSQETVVDAGSKKEIMANSITSPVNSFFPNDLGLYNVCGNVAEMISERGTAVGGSYRDPGHQVRIESRKNFEKASPDIGFRVQMVRVP